tara:strand:+ start:2720 stop:3883 length:1164 start_codon:yes stop_codon:yes gene_type:complete
MENNLEKTIIVGIINKDQNKIKSNEFLDELEFLALTAGSIVKERFFQKIDSPNPKTLIGKGKINEIHSFIKSNFIETIIFDDELSPAQENNISKILKIKVLDRTNLILDIFAQRAKSSYAKTQVELAQCQYLLPRLRGMWTHLERQKGGIGMRGPGETEIETDRRIVRDKISLLKEKIKKIDKQMSNQRGNRGKLVRAALIGYTNVGKSTIMNTISKSNVFAENKLFATVDTTIRKVVVNNLPFLLGDTVGFIRKLPTQLIESFKSTLDEVREADLLLHVIDISHNNFKDHMESVNKTLKEINVINKPTILIFNKIDRLIPKSKIYDSEKHIKKMKKTWISKIENITIFISAKNKLNLDEFKNVIYNEIKKIHIKRFPYNDFLYPNI